MFTGLSAFPVTPFKHEGIDLHAFERLIVNLRSAEVDSICAMGSTGLYPYLSSQEFSEVACNAVDLAQGIPVMVGVGALRTKQVLDNIERAQNAGVSAVLLAPVSYHPLTEREVYALYDRVTQALSVPLCVYENPGVTQFEFSDTLYNEISRMPYVASIKVPGMPFSTRHGTERLQHLRSLVPASVAIGVSGDKFGAAGMAAGCDVWLSVLGGLFPKTVKRLIGAAQANQRSELQTKLEVMWELFVRNKGGMRVMATAADILGFTEGCCLPHPLQGLASADRMTLGKLISELGLD